MFPSCGFFTSIPCQYYANGLCERPYCHFRHSKHDVEKLRETAASSLVDIVNSPASDCGQQSPISGDGCRASSLSEPPSNSISSKDTSLTSDSPEKAPQETHSATHENNAGSFSIPSFTDNSSKYQVPVAEEPEQYVTSHENDSDRVLGSSLFPKTEAGTSALPTYLPTPKTPSLPVPQPAKDDLGIPVYQPTPKRELKRRYEDQVPTKKAKSADLEYDPECNFSCGGLIGVAKDKRKIKKSHDSHYKPTVKKARISGLLCNRTRNRLSCESLIASSPDAADEMEGMLEGEFSEQEEDPCETTNKVAEAMEEGMDNQDDKSDRFENIGDDDISTDDDLIEVPSMSIKASLSKKQEHHSVKLVKKKSAVSGLGLDKNKTSSDKKELNKVVSNKMHKQDKNKASMHSSTSKSSCHKQLSKSSVHQNLKKMSKSSLSQKKSCQSSSTGGSKQSSSTSAKGHLTLITEKGHSSDKTPHLSKQSLQQKPEHRANEAHIKSKREALESNHKDRSTSGKSFSKSSSSDKLHLSGKHSSVSQKTVLSAPSRSVSDSSSVKRPSADGKHKDSGERRSSLDRKISKDHGADGKSKNSSSRQSSFENKALKDVRDKSSEREKHSKIDKKIPGKHSDSDRKCDMKKISVKYSNSDSKTTSDKLVNSSTNRHTLSSGERHSSTDSRPSSTGHSSSLGSQKARELHASSSSIKTGYSSSTSKDHSKDRSAHTGDKTHRSTKPGKEHGSSHTEPERKNSSGKHSNNSKTTHLNSCHKKEKPRDKTSGTNRDSSQTLQRLNASIFGEDSSEDVEDSVMAFDDDNESSDYRGTVEEEQVDYSSYINDSDLEEEDTFDECFRIFKEAPLPKKTTAQPEKKLTKDQKKDGPGTSGATYPVPGKRRIAHEAAEQVRKPQLLKKEKPRHLLSPQEQMHNRIMMMQQRAQQRAAMQAVQEQEVSSTSGSVSKKRIAHIPKPVPTSSTTKTPASKNPKKVTIATTASKTEKRLAHTPNVTNLKRPVIPANFGSKVPSNIRQRYLNLIIDECLKFCPSEEQAYKKGLEEETGVYERASNKNIYLRVAVNSITRLRSEARESMPGSSTPRQRQQSGPSQSHEATLGGARAAKTNFTLHRSLGFGKKTEVALTEPELYKKLLKYNLTPEQLEENGYPRSCPDTPGKAIMLGKSYQETDTLLKDNERTCARCGKRFIVNSDGSYVRDEECVYHWTRAYPRKKSGFVQHIYNCCSSDTSSKGCQVAGNHVHDRNKRDNLYGFMRTIPCSPPSDGNYGIFALDCEMVYTQGGLELARVTVVNVNGDSVFESLVQPFHPIIDCNTRFSGLTAADLADVETTLTDVQAVLLNMFSDKTILIGHSLESDFFALKLIHSTVVDTSVVFPHRLGPPFKRALKNLMLDIFQKIIQCDEGGHDSKEDAVSCLQLMKWRIKEDSKRESRYSRD